MKKIRVSDRTYSKASASHGTGLFAKTKIKKGQIVAVFKGEKTKKDHMHTLWLTNKYGILVKNKAKFANHNWLNPNARSYHKILIAIHDIEKDEEITWDYSVGYAYDQSFDEELPLYDNNDNPLIKFAIDNNNIKLFQQCIQGSRFPEIEVFSEELSCYLDIYTYIVLFSQEEILNKSLENGIINEETISQVIDLLGKNIFERFSSLNKK